MVWCYKGRLRLFRFIWELDSNIGIDMISDKSSPSEVG